MDADVLAQRILLDLKNTFKKDPLIDEFDILPVHESVRNSCPVIHIQHKVALEDWCVKHVYVYCYSNFFAWKRKPTKIDSDTLLLWTMAILLINPEIETVWNARKELLCQIIIQPEDELKFCDVVLSRKPKSSQAFAHRKWVLLRLKKSQLSSCIFQQIIDHEFFLCTRVANSYPNNYYAWCHRSWIIQELLHCCLKTVFEELIRMEDWIASHVSDYSGYHYRQFLISCFHHNPSLTYPSDCPLHRGVVESSESINCSFNNDTNEGFSLFTEYLQKELDLLCELQKIYPGHETLWNHRRYILHEIHKINLTENIFSNEVKILDSASACDAVQCKRHKLESSVGSKINWNVTKEECFLKDSFKAAKGLDWEKILIKRHINWLQNILLWPLAFSFS